MEDNTLKDTLSGTITPTKPRNTDDAKLRRKIVELNERYKDPTFTKKALYMIDGYDPTTIQAEMDNYDSITKGTPLPEKDKTARLENRQRQMMYNDITSGVNRTIIDENTGEEIRFDPNSDVDRADLINDLAATYEGISVDEIVGAVKERLPQTQEAPEENPASDFDFGVFNPANENSLFKRGISKLPGWEWVGEQQPEQQADPNDFFQPDPQPEQGGITLAQERERQQVARENFMNDGEPQVKGARWDATKDAAKDFLQNTVMKSKTLEVYNPAGEVVEEKTIDVPAMGSDYPTAEERYPDKIVRSWDKPNEEVGTEKLKIKGTNYDPFHTAQNRPDSKPEDIGKGAAGIKITDGMVAAAREKGANPFLPYGSIVYVPQLDKKFLVADLIGPKSEGTRQLDFATPNSKFNVAPEYNQDFDIVVLRKGKGKADARKLVESGEWDKLKI